MNSYFRFVLSLISAIIYREVEPFRRRATNLLAYIAQYTLLLTFGTALAIDTNLTRNQNDLFIGIMLVITNLVVLAVALGTGVRRYLSYEHKDRLRLESQAHTVEMAASFLPGNWAKLFDDVSRNVIPRSHCLVFWYTSLDGAHIALRSGIPALESGGLAYTKAGVVFTLHDPSEIEPNDMIVFPKHRREAVLLCSVQKSLLCRITGELNVSRRMTSVCTKNLVTSVVLSSRAGPANHEGNKRMASSLAKSSCDIRASALIRARRTQIKMSSNTLFCCDGTTTSVMAEAVNCNISETTISRKSINADRIMAT